MKTSVEIRVESADDFETGGKVMKVVRKLLNDRGQTVKQWSAKLKFMGWEEIPIGGAHMICFVPPDVEDKYQTEIK